MPTETLTETGGCLLRVFRRSASRTRRTPAIGGDRADPPGTQVQGASGRDRARDAARRSGLDVDGVLHGALVAQVAEFLRGRPRRPAGSVEHVVLLLRRRHALGHRDRRLPDLREAVHAPPSDEGGGRSPGRAAGVSPLRPAGGRHAPPAHPRRVCPGHLETRRRAVSLTRPPTIRRIARMSPCSATLRERTGARTLRAFRHV